MQSKKLCKRDGGARAGAGGRSLPEDIIYEVLLRQPLPSKVRHRLQSVCERWRAIVSSPAFLAERRSRASADPAPIMVAMFGTKPAEYELCLLDMDGNVLKVFDVGPGTAAFLAPTRLGLIFVDRMEQGAMIIDPASGHNFTIVGTDDPQLPPLPYWQQHKVKSTTVNDYSFGRAVPSGEYKVLRLHLFETSSSRRGKCRSQWCEVGTIMDDGAEPTWRQKPWGPFLQTSFACEYKASVGGDLYFLLSDTNSAPHGRRDIATFNLESKEWKAKTMRGPLMGRKNVEDQWSFALTELKGTLCMVHRVQTLTDFGGHYTNLWLLKDPNWSIWTKKYKIQMPETLLFSRPLDVLLDGTLLLLNKWKAGTIEECHRYILQFHNCSTKSFTDFMEMPVGFSGRMAFYTGSFQS